MAKKPGRGFRSPKNYDPRRGAKNTRQSVYFGKENSTRGRGGPGGERGIQGEPRATMADAVHEAKQSVRPRAGETSRDSFKLHDPIQTHVKAIRVESFQELGLGQNITWALADLEVYEPFAIQAVTIPEIIAGKNVLGRAKTGSGKTIAFGAGIIERILILKAQGAFTAGKESKVNSSARRPKTIILAPTRELAQQIDETVQHIARRVGLYTARLLGGLPTAPQLHALRRGADIIIGTPGRVEDLAKRGALDLRDVQIAVLDEADQMSEMGFIEPVSRILKLVKKNAQIVLFSATLDEQVVSVVRRFMPRYVSHEIVGERSDENKVKHYVFMVFYENKLEILSKILRGRKRVLVFVRTRSYVDTLTESLREQGLKARGLHGKMTQEKRQRHLDAFAASEIDILVATDVAARGIHVEKIDLVLQADAPEDSKTYLHRAGRTGRAGAKGKAITIILHTWQKRMRQVLEEAEVSPVFFDKVPAEEVSHLMKELKI